MGEKFNISNLNLYYGDFHALKDVDLTINEKEITAFIGPVSYTHLCSSGPFVEHTHYLGKTCKWRF